MSATCGRIAFSVPGSYATCASAAAQRHTGASRSSKHSSATNAATSAPKPVLRRVDAKTLGSLLRGDLRAVHGGAPRDDRDAIAAGYVRPPAERQHPVGGRHRVAGVALPVQVLVLEEEHRVFGTEGRAQEAGGVARP